MTLAGNSPYLSFPSLLREYELRPSVEKGTTLSTPGKESRKDLESALFGEDGILLHPDVVNDRAYQSVYESLVATFDSAADAGLSPAGILAIVLDETDGRTEPARSMHARIAHLQRSTRGRRLCSIGRDNDKEANHA
ncbi:MAG: hypothetical protein M1522_06855 [Actinobacteria bacterium]|nr:hypothetical protein [Actinomycetota bacterium]